MVPYLDVSVDDAFGVAEVEGVGDGEDYLCDLSLVGTALEVVGSVELTSLAVFHHDIEEARVVVDFVDFDDVGVFQLGEAEVRRAAARTRSCTS